MNRKMIIAVITAALVGGGATTALAWSDGEDRAARAAQAKAGPAEASGPRLSAEQAVVAALKAQPGTAVSVTSHSDDDDRGWEVEILGSGATAHTVHVDPVTGKILTREAERDDDHRDDRTALRGAQITAAEAARAAAAKGVVTSVDLDDRDDDRVASWDVETADGRDWDVNLTTGAVTADHDDADDSRSYRVDDDDDDDDDRYGDDRDDDDADDDGDDHDDD
ncbi:PepSY domain-containing protein [Streptomyces sp. A7024]|uniref:PepSY domain-containing protein n=1 Tax=Streptomyces coryli TaxID=1128680 RepID=A0A6G4TY71_9ACTN|nr:PepSY domain-containing protein [Streptomyces coryli]NGN64925.1 PepSY domain-containing protein [Streptomyces coryli]